MEIHVLASNGYRQVQRLDTRFGSFSFDFRFNAQTRRWSVSVTNEATGLVVNGIVLVPDRNFTVLSRISFGGGLGVILRDDDLILLYRGI